MNLRDTTRDLIAQVEQQTGYMVEVVPDPMLATMSTVIMAGRRTLPAHVIRYNPAYEHILDSLPGRIGLPQTACNGDVQSLEHTRIH